MESKFVISKVEQKQSKNGNSFWAISTNDNRRMTCWDAVVGDQLAGLIGMEVSGVVEEKKGFLTLNTIDSFKEGEATTPAQSGGSYNDRRQTLIVRQCCVKCAVEHHGDLGSVEDITKFAEELENWVLRE
jgi:hypothetical protein